MSTNEPTPTPQPSEAIAFMLALRAASGATELAVTLMACVNSYLHSKGSPLRFHVGTDYPLLEKFAAHCAAATAKEREARDKADEWVCECHPELAWPHGDCPGPGMPKSEQVRALVWQRDEALKAIRALMQISEHGETRKLDVALTWRANDCLARALSARLAPAPKPTGQANGDELTTSVLVENLRLLKEYFLDKQEFEPAVVCEQAARTMEGRLPDLTKTGYVE